MGQKLPTTHLFDPQEILEELRYVNSKFDLIAKKAHQIDKLHPNFYNQPLQTNFTNKVPVVY